MLSPRFNNDGKPAIKLDKNQQHALGLVHQEISQGIYLFKESGCILCGGNDFECISEKDRYGLYYPVRICKECGLVQANPRMDDNSYDKFYQDDYWNLYAGGKARAEKLFESQYERANIIFKFISPYLDRPFSDNHILEIGCGWGGIVKYFTDRGFQVSGIDINQEAVNFGKDLYGLNLMADTIMSHSFVTRPDLIIVSHYLEHSLNPISELARLKEVLEPGGLLYIETPGILNLYSSYKRDFLLYLQNAHINLFTSNTLSGTLNKSGWKVEKSDEFIRCIAIPSTGPDAYVPLKNDYQTTLNFLKELEHKTNNLLIPFFMIREFPRVFIKAILKKMGLYRLFFKYYHLRK
jgi:2-polyprenyl-3-methyl-5-hydroxy-6-metoxy-1,4-benzoquinol methylase